MERLLKIVDGPMKGAEVALISGTRIKVGSGDSCDIVIADSSLPEMAFELDVSDRAVMLVTPAGLTSELADFEIRDFGSTAIAVGPAEGKWGELWRKPAEEPAAPAPEKEPEPVASAAPVEEPAAAPDEPKPAKTGKRRRGGCLWLIILVLLLLALLWYFRVPAKGYARRILHSVNSRIPVATKTTEPEERDTGNESSSETPAQIVSLTQIATEHGLTLEERDGTLVLCGNLKRRTEKMAIRAMALAIDRGVKFDLSDDQSLRTAAENTLYLVSGGSLRVAEVTNRVVVLSGEVKGPGALEKALRALGDDVPQLVTCDTTAVRLSSRIVTSAEADAEAGGEAAEEEVQATKAEKARNFPVAGILTSPYPCVVLTDGSRCLEGSVVGGFTLKKISAEELVFESAGQEVVWRP